MLNSQQQLQLPTQTSLAPQMTQPAPLRLSDAYGRLSNADGRLSFSAASDHAVRALRIQTVLITK